VLGISGRVCDGVKLVCVSAYFEHGMVVYDVTKLRHRYVMSAAFKLDVASVVPTDLVFFVTYESFVVVARLNRVLRIRSHKNRHQNHRFEVVFQLNIGQQVPRRKRIFETTGTGCFYDPAVVDAI